jgi:hypothetical protein
MTDIIQLLCMDACVLAVGVMFGQLIYKAVNYIRIRGRLKRRQRVRR